MVGRQTPFLALIVPFVLIFMVDGSRGIRDSWPVALMAGLCSRSCQFAVSNYVSTQLTDIIASLASTAAVVLLLRGWSPRAVGEPSAVLSHVADLRSPVARRPTLALDRRLLANEGQTLSRRDLLLAFAPYAIIIVVLGVTSLHGISTQLDKATSVFKWPGLNVLTAKGKAPTSETFKLTWLTAAGHMAVRLGCVDGRASCGSARHWRCESTSAP